MMHHRERGLALILVMTVVMALAIIATPFVLSMILQERTGTTARYISQADYGADGAKNYAIWRLMPSLDPLERRNPQGLTSSYTYDTDREFDIHLDEDPLKSRMKIADPKGSIWGVTVQDEQGKLNTKTCNVNGLRTLSGLVDGRVVNLKDYLTLYSGRDATWICPQRIRQHGFNKGTPTGGATVDHLEFLGPQSRVRVSKAGLRPLETKITSNVLLGGGGGQDGFTTKDPISSYIDGVIEVEQRHPVNLNTAKKETLIAMWEGLHLYQVPGSTVDRGAATQLATRFFNREMQRLEQFLIQLSSTSLSIPQKIAVALNAVCPNSTMLDGSGTVPICFKSYDVYTLEAFASMNSPAGTEAAGRGYREVVSVSAPITLRRYCESQYDFNQMYSQVQIALENLNPKLALTGYPFGNRVLTYPRPYTQLCDILLKPQQGGPGSPNEAYVTMLPAEDNRGELLEQGYENELAGNWDSPHNRNHYPTEMDGKKESGPETFDWKQFFALSHLPEDNPPNQNQRPDTGSGGFEIWTRWDSTPGSATLFDIKEHETTNRVTLRVENNELLLTAADSTIPNSTDPDGRIANGVAEIRWPNFKINQDTWTHFGAYWKSNRYADLAMLVDGFSDPQAKFMHYTGPGGSELMTKLSSALTPTSTSLTLKNSGILPSASELSPIQIGDEVILYDHSAGTVVRGARGTVPEDHPSQANVSLFGYSSKIRNGQVLVTWPPGVNYSTTLSFDRIPKTNATLTYNFGLAPAANVCGDKMDPIKPGLWEFSPTATQLGVISPNIMDYPDQGYIRVDDEVLLYTGRSTGGVAGTFPPSTAKFTGLTRAMFGSVAAPHPMDRPVHLWSVAANNLNNYPQRTIIQVGGEWFGPVQKDPSGKNYWVGFMNGPVPVNFERGTNCLFSVPSSHSAGDKVLPTFLGRDVNSIPSTTLASMGAGDRVTLVDGSNQKAVARIRRTSSDPRPNGVAGWAGSFQIQGNAASQIAALYDFTTRDWVADDLHCRILKFPSGELLSRAWLDTASPRVTIGPVAGQIDELKAFAGSKGRIRLALQAGVGDTNLTLHPTVLGPFVHGGLMKVGDEYLGYGSWPDPANNGKVTQVKRGWLNSTAELHDKGDVAFYLPWIPVAALGGDVNATDKVIHLKQHLSGDWNKYTSGYVLLDNEMVLFQWNGGDGLTLSMPPTMDGQRGLYRGMFGTQPASHSSTASLAYGMPFRIWDTYKAREFDNSMVYFQWSTQLDLAHWNSYLWRQTLPQGEKNIVVHGLARMDGKGDFWDPPGLNDLTLLVDSVTGTGKLNRIGHLNDAGQLDVRFYFEYKPGSFDAQNPRNAESWKRAPKIQEIQVEYDRPIQTLHHEDR